MTLCGSYNGEYSIRGGRVDMHNNKMHILRLYQSLTEAVITPHHNSVILTSPEIGKKTTNKHTQSN